jgi:hypothetical protein
MPASSTTGTDPVREDGQIVGMNFHVKGVDDEVPGK